MPDLRDLHDEFARLEQQIPEYYRSPVIAERVSQLLDQTDRKARPGRHGTIGMALLAAAAVVALAVAVVSINTRTSDKQRVGNPTPSHTATTSPPATNSPTNTASTQQTSTPTHSGNGMPASASALVAYVNGGTPVQLSDYQQAEPGPGQAMRPTPGTAEFNTPSGNITCAIVNSDPGAGANVVCTAQQFSFHIPPKPATCQNNWVAYFGFIARGQVSVGACVGGPEFGPTTQDLPYGSMIQQGGVGCRSESGFLACADLSSGHGFAVNRDTLKTY